MTDKETRRSKLSYYKSTTDVNELGRGTITTVQLEVEGQTDDGAWELFEKLKQEAKEE